MLPAFGLEVRKWNESIWWKSGILYAVKPSQLPIHIQKKKKKGHQPFSHILSLKEYFNFKASYIKILYNPLAFCRSLMLILFIERSQLIENIFDAIKLNTIPYLDNTQYTSLFILTTNTHWHCLGKMNFNLIWI